MTSEREVVRACGECGMPVLPYQYHPYAACLMFKACHHSGTVEANLQAVIEKGREEGLRERR